MEASSGQHPAGSAGGAQHPQDAMLLEALDSEGHTALALTKGAATFERLRAGGAKLLDITDENKNDLLLRDVRKGCTPLGSLAGTRGLRPSSDRPNQLAAPCRRRAPWDVPPPWGECFGIPNRSPDPLVRRAGRDHPIKGKGRMVRECESHGVRGTLSSVCKTRKASPGATDKLRSNGRHAVTRAGRASLIPTPAPPPCPPARLSIPRLCLLIRFLTYA